MLAVLLLRPSQKRPYLLPGDAEPDPSNRLQALLAHLGDHHEDVLDLGLRPHRHIDGHLGGAQNPATVGASLRVIGTHARGGPIGVVLTQVRELVRRDHDPPAGLQDRENLLDLVYLIGLGFELNDRLGPVHLGNAAHRIDPLDPPW